MSRQRQKGTAWEKKITDFLADQGIPYQRQPLHGVNDKGDIHAAGFVVIEAKNQARHSLGEWLDEATSEAANAGRPVGVAWFHRRGKSSAKDAYVLMDGATFAFLLREIGPAPEGDTR